MPRSRRNRVITLSNVTKKDKEAKTRNFDDLSENLLKFKRVVLLNLSNINSNNLKELRKQWDSETLAEEDRSKLVVSKKNMIIKSLENHKEEFANLEKLIAILQKQHEKNATYGVLYTNYDYKTVIEFFDSYLKKDFAKSNSKSPITFNIPKGVIYSRGGFIPVEDDIPMAHSLEPILRNKYKIPTSLKDGKIVLDTDYHVCEQGQTLNVVQCLILRQFGISESEYKVEVMGAYNKEAEEICK
ncbi:hypothetical protein HANVADRAFT_21011 [Hanseniaspora valbyensis NRRL Y-1626]|uniref:Large ribosomal subunit protein uL10-like insertion domain-containing protein n=1 Tax=Hanseniaspora valbyensis NRRL Y-1626 TaxID=766949 RepID=A0A1B7TJ88_9ASCO|nr:hypothetical protein HANVADRAFT_21011 [Hanseniaspora valbyensis NRRL Y-1626]